MNKLVKTVGALGLAATVAVGMIVPATAAPWRHYHRSYYYTYAPAYDYYPGYYGYYPYYDPGAAIASGIIGGIFGAIASDAYSHRCHHVYHRNGRAYCR